MKILNLDGYSVNLDAMSYAEFTPSSDVLVHFVAPVPTLVPGIPYPQGATPPTASDHLKLVLSGENAEAFRRKMAEVS